MPGQRLQMDSKVHKVDGCCDLRRLGGHCLILCFFIFIILALTPFQSMCQELLITNLGGNNVLRYNGTTGAFIDLFASGGLSDPEGLAIEPDGNLYVSSYNTNEILRYNGITGAFMDVFVPAGRGGLDTPEDIVFGPDGNLYVVAYGLHSVLRYNGTTGAFIDAFVPAGSGGLQLPNGFTFGPDGNLYVAGTQSRNILKYNGTTGAFMGQFVPPGSGGLIEPSDVVFGPDGNLYVTSSAVGGGPPGQVLRYDGTTGAFMDAFVPAGSGGLSAGRGLAFGPDGNLYVTDLFNDRVLRYNGTTGAFINAFVPAGSGGLRAPRFMIFHITAPHTTAISPNTGGDIGRVSVVIYGQGFAQNATVKLMRPGQPDILGTSVQVRGLGDFITTTFDLAGQARGPWTVVVVNPDGTSITLPDGFTIEEGRPADVWVDGIGRNTMRIGRPQTNYIVYGNRGNVDSSPVAIAVSFPPFITGTLMDPQELSISEVTDEGDSLITVLIPAVPGLRTSALPLSLTVPNNPGLANQTIPVSVWVDPILGACPRIRLGQNLTSQNAPESTIGHLGRVLLPPKIPIFAFLGQAPSTAFG